MKDQKVPDLIVIDRNVENFERCAWTLRRVLGETIDAGFAKWVTSAGRGRFLVLAYAPDLSIEERFVFIDNVEELLSHVLETVRAIAVATGRDPKTWSRVTPDVRERFEALGRINLPSK